MMRMRQLIISPDLASWQGQARLALAAGWSPEEVVWTERVKGQVGQEELGMFAEEVAADNATEKTGPTFRVSKAFVELAQRVVCHTSPQRWAVLYRVLWRMTRGEERHLLAVSSDPDVRQLLDWSKTLGRDIHKMHAFVRFRLVGTDEATGREQFVAWFEPEHRIVRMASSFFLKRFAGMDWSILTPLECVHWDGERLHFTPGVSRKEAPDGDVLDDLWRTYYRSIFNPARLKVKAMQSEMPKKYWKNLPEAELIDELIAGSAGRVRQMLANEELEARPAPNNAYLAKLRAMNEEPGE